MPQTSHRSVLGRLAGVAVSIALAAGGLPALVAPTTASAAPKCTSTVFSSTSKYRYRVPAVVTTPSGRVFVFAEKRINNYDNDDFGNFDIVMRTSPDGGCTWTAARTILSDGNNRVSNPTPIYDPTTNQVILLSTIRANNLNLLYLQRISADGSSVSGRTLVAKTDWMLGGVSGPGHALVLTKGEHAGRLLIAYGYTRDNKRTAQGLYSDDGGRTWNAAFTQASPSGYQLIEGTLAELPDGRVLVSYRDRGYGVTKPGLNRVSGISTDGGATVSTFVPMPGIKTVPVQGSLLQTSGYGDLLLFSSPSYTGGKLTSRRGMRIFVSDNQGASWHPGVSVGGSMDPASYSDLVQLNGSTVGIAYENGWSGRYWKKITFTRVSLSSIAKSLLPSMSRSVSPKISGTARVGKTLTASTGVWAPSAEQVSFRWLRNGKPISGATNVTYKLKKADRRKKISVRVTVSAAGYNDTVATSASRKIR